MYLLLHHRQPLACRFCLGAPHAVYAIHYHWAFAQHTGSPVPCLGTMVNDKVKDILTLKPNLYFPTTQPGINCNTTCSLAAQKWLYLYRQVLHHLKTLSKPLHIQAYRKWSWTLDVCLSKAYFFKITGLPDHAPWFNFKEHVLEWNHWLLDLHLSQDAVCFNR